MATTTNQKRLIATKGTAHIAWTGDDECESSHMHVNWVGSSMLKRGATVLTFIDGQSIWTRDGELGAPSYRDDACPKVGKTSHVLNNIATPLTASFDVFAEGAGVVRTDDLTWQNRKNCEGIVILGKDSAQGDIVSLLPPQCEYLLPGGQRRGTFEAPPDVWARMTGPTSSGTLGTVNLVPLNAVPGSTPTDFVANVVSVGGRNIPVLVPTMGGNFPTLDQIRIALGNLSGPELASVQTIVLSPYEYTRPGEALAAVDPRVPGVITFYPSPSWAADSSIAGSGQNLVNSTMFHEATHTLENLVEGAGGHAAVNAYDIAAAADEREVSGYSKKGSVHEDMAESFVMYRATKGTLCEHYARLLYPNRYAFWDRALGPFGNKGSGR